MCRAAADADDEGMYFNSPPASRNNNAPASTTRAPAAPKSAPKSNGSAHRSPPSGGRDGDGVVQMQEEDLFDEEEEEEEEEEEDDYDTMDEVAAYQQKLRAQGAPGSGELQVQDDNDALGMEVSEYQLQLRNRDEADAVSGLASGNLSEIVSTREAPRSASSISMGVHRPMTGGVGVRSTTMSSKMATPDSNRSALGGGGFDDSMMGSGPDECTCVAGRNSLCPYCRNMNGPASTGRCVCTCMCLCLCVCVICVCACARVCVCVCVCVC